MSAESAANESVISTFSVDEQLSRPLAAPVPDAAHPVPKVAHALAHREGLLTDIDGYASMHRWAGQRGNNEGTHDVQGIKWTASLGISADCAPARQDLKERDYVGTPAGSCTSLSTRVPCAREQAHDVDKLANVVRDTHVLDQHRKRHRGA